MVDDAQVNQAKFWKKIQKLTRGRIDILRAMEIAMAEERNSEFKAALERVYAEIREGSELSKAMEAAADHFSYSVRELIRSAEKTGAWDDILPLIAEGLEDNTFD